MLKFRILVFLFVIIEFQKVSIIIFTKKENDLKKIILFNSFLLAGITFRFALFFLAYLAILS